MKSLMECIELRIRIVLVIADILAVIAIPAYQDYTVRAKVSEVITAGAAAKSAISEGFQTNGMPGVQSAAAAVANTGPVSKYLQSIATTAAGVITLTTSADASLPTDARSKTIRLAPYAKNTAGANAALAAGAAGSVEWACASTTNAQATSRLSTLTAVGTLPAKYAPSECR